MRAFDILKSRGVTRLCHFTKFQSLTHILSEDGIKASDSILEDTKNVIDTNRHDGKLDYICCSVEYPNSWFLNKAMDRNQDPIFKEWVVLYIDLNIIINKKAIFCPCNASKEKGKYINDNIDQIEDIFANNVKFCRTSNMLSCCPTDGQAEILIKNAIPKDYITGIAVIDEDVAGRICGMLNQLGLKKIPIYIAPDVLNSKWSNMIKNGLRPTEVLFNYSRED